MSNNGSRWSRRRKPYALLHWRSAPRLGHGLELVPLAVAIKQPVVSSEAETDGR